MTVKYLSETRGELQRDSTTFQEAAPTGYVILMAGALPARYLLCNGAAYSRNTYADLFAVIGTTYGSGDGNTTFNVPNVTPAEANMIYGIKW